MATGQFLRGGRRTDAELGPIPRVLDRLDRDRPRPTRAAYSRRVAGSPKRSVFGVDIAISMVRSNDIGNRPEWPEPLGRQDPLEVGGPGGLELELDLDWQIVWSLAVPPWSGRVRRLSDRRRATLAVIAGPAGGARLAHRQGSPSPHPDASGSGRPLPLPARAP